MVGFCIVPDDHLILGVDRNKERNPWKKIVFPGRHFLFLLPSAFSFAIGNSCSRDEIGNQANDILFSLVHGFVLPCAYPDLPGKPPLF